MEKKKKPILTSTDTDNTHKVLRSKRNEQPSHYTMRIESFSLLSKLLEKSGADKYDSKEFMIEGSKWRLVLYPNGNKKKDVNGYVSLYLEMTNARNLTLGSSVYVIIKFFLADQIREKYVTFEDGKVWSFNTLKNMRGISRLVSLSAFKDPANGYLIDDGCTFGVEVFVVQCKGEGETITILNEPKGSTLFWKIDKFSSIKDHQWSKKFTLSNVIWNVVIHPNGWEEAKGKYVSLSIHIHDHSALRPGWKVYAAYKLILKDQSHDKHLTKTSNKWFWASNLYSGFTDFVSLKDLNDEKKGFIVKDTVIVEAQITFISVINSFA